MNLSFDQARSDASWIGSTLKPSRYGLCWPSSISVQKMIAGRFQPLPRAYHFAGDDLFHLLSIIHQIDWMHGQAVKKQMDDGLWAAFARTAITAFHVMARAMMDHVAVFIRETGIQRKVSPESYDTLATTWIGARSKNRGVIGHDVANIVADSAWFTELRRVRNSLVHEGSEPLVFPAHEYIGFQVYNGFEQNILPPAWFLVDPSIEKTNNLVDFRCYGAFMTTRILRTWHEVRHAVLERMVETQGWKRVNDEAQTMHGGLRVLQTWSQYLETRLPR